MNGSRTNKSKRTIYGDKSRSDLLFCVEMNAKKTIASLAIVGATNPIDFACAEGDKTVTCYNEVAIKQCNWFMEVMERGAINYLPCESAPFLKEVEVATGPYSFCLINIPLSLATGLAESFLQSEFWYLRKDGDAFICTRFVAQINAKNNDCQVQPGLEKEP